MKESDLDMHEIVSQAEVIIKESAKNSILDREGSESRRLQKIFNKLLSVLDLEIREERRYTPEGVRRDYKLVRSDSSNRAGHDE